MSEVFIQRFPIDAADIDELGHVNNIVYLRYAQDIAIAHWRARATEQMLTDYVWVVARHEVDYRSQLTLGDNVEVRTYVADAAQGAVWPRFVDIYRQGEQRPAAQIKSNWCLLDPVTRRIKRIPPDIVARFSQKDG